MTPGKSNSVPCRAGCRSQDAREGAAVAAADVGDGSEGREIVGIENGRRFAAVDADHGLVEDGRLLGTLGEKLEDGLAEDLVERGLARLHAVEQLAPGLVMLLSHHDGHRPLRAGNVVFGAERRRA